MDNKRELNALAEVLLILTREIVENPTSAIKDAFRYASREVVTPTLASEAAYNDFFKRTGKDIRKYDWRCSRTISTKEGEKIDLHKLYTGDHIQTCSHFKKELEDAYKKASLSVDLIVEKLESRYVCWITKEEDKKLTTLGYKSDRSNPEQAYKESGIVIYQEKTSRLLKSTSDYPMQTNAKSLKSCASPKEFSEGVRAKIGEYFTFTNEKIEIKKNVFAYYAYNEIGKRIGYVFETLDKRTPAYKNAELGFFEEYKGKKYCRFTSLGEKVGWFYLSEKIKQEKQITLYID